MARDPLIGATTSDYLITHALHGTPDRGVYRGRDREARNVLITTGAVLREDAPPPRLHETFGIARLRHVGAIDGRPHHATLVEDEPRGTAIGSTPLPEPLALKYATELLRIVGAADAPLGGVAAELVYAENGAVTALAPRGQAFLEAGVPFCYGVPHLFTTRYLAPERLALRPWNEAADVFAVGVALSYWLTGEHPFEGEHDDTILAMMQNRRRPWRGQGQGRLARPALGAVIDELLAPAPGDRPLPAEAVTALQSAAVT